MVTTTRKQAGFTLIELMVVVVIMAIILSVGVMAIKPSEQAQLRTHANQVKVLLQFVRDQSALEHKLYLVSPSEEGLSIYRQANNQWQQQDNIKTVQWHESIHVAWQVDQLLAQGYQLPAAGWLIWPSGEVSAGAIAFSLRSAELYDASEESQSGNQLYLSWNGLLQFKQQNQLPNN